MQKHMCISCFLVLATPAEVIDHYYCFLSNNLDNSILCQNMLKLELINEEDLMVAAKMYSDYKKNAFLLDQLMVADSAGIIKFCYLLLTNHQDVGHMLVNGKNRSDYGNYEMVNKFCFLCYYVAIESKHTSDMNTVGTLSHYQPISITESNLTVNDGYQPKVFLAAKGVHLRFLCLVAQLKQLLKNYELQNFLDVCNKLTADTSLSKAIPLIPSDYLDNLGNADVAKILSRLTFLWTWYNHSILRALLEACNCQDGIEMLDEFESQIDANQPMELFPIPPPSIKMAPYISSTYTVLSIRCEQYIDELAPLHYISDVAKIMFEKFDISPHALQLLAAQSSPLMLYWMILKSVIPLIISGANEHLDFFNKGRFSEITIYPGIIVFATDNTSHGSYAMLGTQLEVSIKL